MRKSTRIGKRPIALFLVLLLSIESFAATVGDNDGAAFITKAEFDSLKNTFQAQIDQYNSSIDNKIDGAIASYLAGIKTTRQKDMKILVENYNNIHWLNNYKFKAKRKTWTNNSTLSYQSSDDEWQTPRAERRMNLRGAQDFFLTRNIFGSTTIGLTLRLINGNHRFGVFTQANDGAWKAAPILALSLAQKDQPTIDNSSRWYLEGQYNSITYNRPMWRNDHSSDDPDGAQYGADSYIILDTTAPVAFNNAVSPFALDFYVKGVWNRPSVAGTAANVRYKYRDVDLLDNLFFQTWYTHSWTLYDTITTPLNDDYGIGDHYFDDGCSIYKMTSTNETRSYEEIRNGMLGTDSGDMKVNIYRLQPNNYWSGFQKPYTTYAEFDTLPLTCTQVQYTCLPSYGTVSPPENQKISGLSIPASIKLPLLERVDYKSLYNNNFKVNGNNLRVGEGIPLILDCTDDGTVLIEFDYAVGRRTDTNNSDQKIIMSIKNSNFLDTDNTVNTNYYQGILNGNECTLKDQAVKVDPRHVEIEIPNVRKESNMWLRLASTDTDGGYFTTISKLKIKMLIE